ncbi:MAG: HlyD family type I secretion periplasmic adaptor subunit [Roseobacter sp.]
MSEKTPWSARVPMTVGLISIFLLLGSLGTWAMATQIAGAVVATGTVEVESDRQVVQHPDGGVVGEINVRDGDMVRANDVLVRFDDTFLLSELAVVERQLLEAEARQIRLSAERDGTATPEFITPETFANLDEDWVASQMDGQRNLFEARRQSIAQESRQLEEQKLQIENQIVGIEAQRAALDIQLELILEESTDLSDLLARGLVPAARVLELLREEARLKGEIGNLTARIAEARGRIAAIAIEVIKLTDSRREEAITTLRDLRFSEIDLTQRRLQLYERLSRLDVRAPVAGTVFGTRVFALQSVVQPAEPMMYIVPGDQPLQVSARIDPIHIDQVFPGQPVALRFSTFDQRTTPEVNGIVERVSADTVMDEATGFQYYEAILQPSPEELAGLPDVELLPGMPVEAFLRTRDRTPLSYLTQPLTSYFNRAFRED